VRKFARVLLAASLAVLSVRLPAYASDADTFYSDVKAGQYENAISVGNQYLAAHPHDDTFAIDLAYAYLKVGKWDAVRSILLARDEYLHAHPDAAAIWLALSFDDSAQKQYRMAISDVDRYLRYRPDDEQAWRQRSYAVAALTPATPAPVVAPDASVLFYNDVAAGHVDDALPYGRTYLAANPKDASFAVDVAYAYLQAKDPDGAAALAEQYKAYVTTDPNAMKLLPALFYAYQSAGNLERALAYGNEYLALQPADDNFAMDLAYAELRAGDVARVRALLAPRSDYLRTHPDAAKLWLELSYREAAAKNYSAAETDVDTYLTLQPNDAAAKAQRVAFATDAWGGPRATTFATAYYDGRFNDTFLYLDHIYTLAPNRGVQPYLVAHLSGDTNSGAPGTPQIYSDNALVTDAGLRATIVPHLTAFVEGGAGIGLRGQGTISDLRYGALYGEQWGNTPYGYTSVDMSAGVYSRYGGNTICYYDVTHGFQGRNVRPILGLNGGLDSHDVYGNNFIEGLYGVEIGSGTLKYRIVGVQGTYLRTLQKGPYSDFRAMIVLGLSH
jgi:Flp pilus assembly protein TadD